MTILSLTKVDVGMMEDVGTSANQLVQLDSNAKIPAVDGSLLTGLGGLSGSSDPTISTNPGTVGKSYKNTTSGEMYICTDATAGANVWTNVGAGSGDIADVSNHQGKVYGYIAGGTDETAPHGAANNTIQRFSFTSDSNATDVGDMTQIHADPQGYSSTTHGYCCGGYFWPVSAPGDTINKYAFASSAAGSDIGNLAGNTYGAKGVSDTHGANKGYQVAGNSYNVNLYIVNFASDGNVTDSGYDLFVAAYAGGGTASNTHGYSMGGGVSGTPQTNVIQKFPFASLANSTDVGDLADTVFGNPAGGASTTHGYSSGGSGTGPFTTRSNKIEKFSFVSDGNGTDIGNLLVSITQCTGGSSDTHNYVCGGDSTGSSTDLRNEIQKWSHASDGDATDVANLTIDLRNPTTSWE